MKTTTTRIPCPTIYPRRERWTAGMDPDQPGIVTTDVPCEGRLVECAICGAQRRCTYEARCLDADAETHVVQRLFSINDGDVFQGWTRGETWNGWACPRFERDAALRIVASMNDELPDTMAYDDATMVITYIPDGDLDAKDEWLPELLETAEGPRFVYAIGAWAWVWDDVTDDHQPEPDKDMDGTFYHRPDFDTRDREGR